MEPNIRNTESANFSLNDNRIIERDSWKVMLEHLYSDMGGLLRKESMLIRTEVSEKLTEFKLGLVSLIMGASILIVGLFATVATSIILLDLVMDLWAASAIVTAVLLVTGFVMVSAAKKKLEMEKLKPKQSIETFEEISNTFKERFNELNHH